MESNFQLKVKIFVQPNWVRTHREIEITLPQDNLDNIKKALLSGCRAPSSNLDKFDFLLQYMGLDMPISHEDDFYFMLSDLLQDPERLIIININKIVVKRRAKKQFAFDEIGTANPTLENDGDIVLNRPSDKMYHGPEEVQCAFCRTSNKDKSAIRDLGPFYGPFKNKTKNFYVHELCAIWTPDVYLDPKTDKLKNLLKEVKRCNKMMCSHCGRLGGGLGCLDRNCKKSYHFKCCLDDNLNCQLDYKEHTLYCPDHAEKDDELDINIESVFCKVCDGGDDENLMLLCEKCLQGYHTYCLNPPLKEVPEDKWYCDRCAMQIIAEDPDEELSQCI